MKILKAPPHIGRKIQRIRELKGIKQETIANELGISRQAISKIEQSEGIEDEKLQQVAKALGVSPEAIKEFDEEMAINIISNTFTDFKDNAVASAMNYQCTFNPIEKIVELFEENKNLYERMLEVERSKIKLLEDQLKSHKK